VGQRNYGDRAQPANFKSKAYGFQDTCVVFKTQLMQGTQEK